MSILTYTSSLAYGRLGLLVLLYWCSTTFWCFCTGMIVLGWQKTDVSRGLQGGLQNGTGTCIGD